MNSYLESVISREGCGTADKRKVLTQFLAETEAQKQKSQLTFKKLIVATIEYASWSIKGDKNHRK